MRWRNSRLLHQAVESIEVEVPTRGEVQAIHLETKARILKIRESGAGSHCAGSLQ